MQALENGVIDGFMKSLIMYNISNFTDFDDHAKIVCSRV